MLNGFEWLEERLEEDTRDRVAKAREKLKSVPNSVISPKAKAVLREGLTLSVSKNLTLEERRPMFSRIEKRIEKRGPGEPERERTWAEKLNSIIDWKIEGLRRELTTGKVGPSPEWKQAEAWLVSSSPTLFDYFLRLEEAGLIERTDRGLNWRCRQTAVVMLLRRCGFNDWKGFSRHCLINGKPAKEGSLKNQSPARVRPPKDWDKILAAITGIKPLTRK